ncbi:hypothetical protein [Natrinema sp. DC36]|uniref:hypothetical protein n=1 Tax=Natrinema sp. DC36 TaxID=2878680 RepID=UPI001CF0C70F|nr:hypothetical protein [Natrinema sp. DC36]
MNTAKKQASIFKIMNLLNADDDWIESTRRWLYPKLHPYLKKIGGYGIGTVGENQYVMTTEISEEPLEVELVDLGFVRNPIACYKTLEDGRKSEGSWVLYHNEAPQIVAEGMQLHVTLFNDNGGMGIYAHYEHDWRADWWAHLNEKDFSPEKGVEKATEALHPIDNVEVKTVK